MALLIIFRDKEFDQVLFYRLIENSRFLFLHFFNRRSLNFTRFQLLAFPLIIWEFLWAFKHLRLWFLVFMKRRKFTNILLHSLWYNVVVRCSRIIFGNRMHINIILLNSLITIILLSYVLSALLLEHFDLLDFICFLLIWVVNEVNVLEFKVALGRWTVWIVVLTFQRAGLILFRMVFLHKVLDIHIILFLSFFIFDLIKFLFNVMIMIY